MVDLLKRGGSWRICLAPGEGERQGPMELERGWVEKQSEGLVEEACHPVVVGERLNRQLG